MAKYTPGIFKASRCISKVLYLVWYGHLVCAEGTLNQLFVHNTDKKKDTRSSDDKTVMVSQWHSNWLVVSFTFTLWIYIFFDWVAVCVCAFSGIVYGTATVEKLSIFCCCWCWWVFMSTKVDYIDKYCGSFVICTIILHKSQKQKKIMVFSLSEDWI